MKMRKLYLDDVRCPKTEGWDIVRTYDDFVSWITINGLPNEVSFDHDLAEIHYDPKTYTESFKYEEKTGYDAAKWLVDYCAEKKAKFPRHVVHSMNPIGKERIDSYIENAKTHLGI
jgi:hypothetical protein